MTPETLAALKESIEHWERIAAGTNSPDEDIFCESCALCEMFYSIEGCAGCPVFEKTGLNQCLGSPWPEVWRHWDDKESEQYKAAVNKQLEFLKSLLPQ